MFSTLPIVAALCCAPAVTCAEASVVFSSHPATEQGFPHALQAALKYNPAVKGQLAQLSVQEHAIDTAKAGRYPSMSVSADTLNEGYTQGTLRVDQPLWTFGKISSAIEGAEADSAVQKQGLLQVKRELLEKTAAAYTEVHSARLKIVVASDNLAEHQRLYQRIQRRQQGQLASLADVRLARSRLLQAKSDLLRHEGALKAALTELYALTQVQVPTEQPINRALLELPDAPQVRKLAAEQSGGVIHARERVNLARVRLKQVETDPYPTLSLRLEQNLLETSPGMDSDETRIGLVLEGKLNGMGFTSYSQVQAASESISAAQHELDSVRNEVVRQADNLLVNRELQGGLRASHAESVEALEQTMASFLRQYETNRKSWVEVLNQQRELTNMRYALIVADQQWLVLSLRIAAMTGLLDKIAGVEK